VTSQPSRHEGARWQLDAATAAPLLRVRDLSVTLRTRRGDIKAVDGVSLDVMPGSALGLVGESGSGKSILLRGILGLLPDDAQVEGQIYLENEELNALAPKQRAMSRGKNISVIFQDPMTALNPVRRIGAQIAEGPIVHYGLRRPAARARAIELLTEVGIPDAAEVSRRYPHELSGGMRQRALIAMALACDPKIILCDEPTTALDVTLQKKIIDLLRRVCLDRGVALLFVSHDLAVVSELCDFVNVMYAGRFVETGLARQVISSPRHVYTWALLRSLPPVDGPRVAPLSIGGLPPDRLHPPTGCRFHPRCPVAQDVCVTLPYDLKDVGNGRRSACIYGAGPLPVTDEPGAVTDEQSGVVR
jgi:peptide/nickel transport system ATP-binding protein